MDLPLGCVRRRYTRVPGRVAQRRAEPNRAAPRRVCHRLCSILLLFQEVGETARK